MKEKVLKHNGNLEITKENQDQYKHLVEVTGYLSIYSNATLQIPSLKNKEWKSVDDKLFIIESEKTSNGIKIYSGYNVKGIKKNKFVKEVCFVAEKNDFFAHGITVKKAIQDLQFKIVSDKLKKDPIKKDTKFTVKYYRLLTGACDHGCRSWMSQNGIDFTIENEGTDSEETVELKPIKAVDLLPILEKSKPYGYEKFKSLIAF